MADYILAVDQAGLNNTATRVSDAAPLPIAVLPSTAAATAPTNSTTTALVNSLIVKASSGNLYGFSGYNSKATSQFIQVFDSATVPADGATAVINITVPATSNFSYSAGRFSRRFNAGIVITNSSTAPTKTIGVADCSIDVQFA